MLPELPSNIEELAIRSSKPKQRIQGVTRSWWNQRNLFVTERLKDISKDIIVVDATGQFVTLFSVMATIQTVTFTLMTIIYQYTALH